MSFQETDANCLTRVRCFLRSTADQCTCSERAKIVEPPSLAPIGSAYDYRQISREKYECPSSRVFRCRHSSPSQALASGVLLFRGNPNDS